ncbi:hypothetical protein GHT06_021380 [Daphnia sinensis]|uniref:Uncharacterized protein n=1 Tax=Daphnia sinensis TaxID=1820382 RepID=A0AAD5PSG6_9CRUS|nr:hypothetical protein GHT06_021380 [Daphnia sinensis]
MAVRLDSPSGSVSYRRAPAKLQTNNGWSTLGRSTSRQLQSTPAVSSKTTTLRRHRSRSRSAALHCLSVPELSSDEEDKEEVGRKEEEEEEEDDCYCYADWHQQESYQPALVVWTPGLNHHQWSRSSTPIKTATLRSALRSSITRYGD